MSSPLMNMDNCHQNDSSQGIYLYKRQAFPLTQVEISTYVSADESHIW